MKIIADASLPYLTELFRKPFIVHTYESESELRDALTDHDILLCRSTLKVNASLLDNSTIRSVATASSGIDHIDADYLAARHIPLLSAQGCNAHSVADYVIAVLAWLQHYHSWQGQTAGIIGLGATGSIVAKRLLHLGFKLVYYDPIRQMSYKDYPYAEFKKLQKCDLICIHANLHTHRPYPSNNLINATLFQHLKQGSVIINTSRGGIVNEAELLTHGKHLIYCTDVYSEEPFVTKGVIQFATSCTPHIAGHSIEAKINAVYKLSQQLHQQYGLDMPSFEMSEEKLALPAKETWQETLLQAYNPVFETKLLKNACDKKAAFLAARAAHSFRHDFTCYEFNQLNTCIHSMLQ